MEVGNTVGDRTFYEAHFHHLLAANLDLSGYGIRKGNIEDDESRLFN